MRCEDFLSEIDLFLDGELDDMERARMLEHAKNCASCQDALRSAEQLNAILSTLDDDVSVPVAAQAAWRNAIRRESRKRATRLFVRTASAVAAAFVLMVGVTAAFRAGGKLDSGLSVENLPFHAPQATAPTYVNSISYAPDNGVAPVIESDGDLSGEPTTFQTGAGGSDMQRSASKAEPDARLFVKSASRELETQEFDEAYARIDDLVQEYGGYFKSNAVEQDAVGRIAKLLIAVPTEDMDAFLSAASRAGNVVRQEDLAEDISIGYYDAQSRLDTLQAEKTRLNELMQQASDADEIEKLRTELQDVYLSIEAVQSNIASYRSQLEDAEISIVLYEGAARGNISSAGETENTSLGGRMAKAFRASSAFFADMAVSFAIIAPFVLVVLGLAIVVFLVTVLVKRIKRK